MKSHPPDIPSFFAESIKEQLAPQYDFIFIDFPDNLSKMDVNALSLSGTN